MKKYNKYGLTAIKALDFYKIEDSNSLKESWLKAAAELFDSQSSQNKGCPRSTFLSICEEGLIKGISKGAYESNSTKNKTHAIEAVAYLKENKVESISAKELWSKLNIGNKSHNSQMDVVLALWFGELII
jgi:hypothetical protein